MGGAAGEVVQVSAEVEVEVEAVQEEDSVGLTMSGRRSAGAVVENEDMNGPYVPGSGTYKHGVWRYGLLVKDAEGREHFFKSYRKPGRSN